MHDRIKGGEGGGEKEEKEKDKEGKKSRTFILYRRSSARSIINSSVTNTYAASSIAN